MDFEGIKIQMHSQATLMRKKEKHKPPNETKGETSSWMVTKIARGAGCIRLGRVSEVGGANRRGINDIPAYD